MSLVNSEHCKGKYYININNIIQSLITDSIVYL